MGVIADYQDIPALTGADLPPKLVDEDSPAKWTAAPVGGDIPTQLGLKDNAIIDSIDTVGARLNAVIDTVEKIGIRTNQLITNMNWLGNAFENVQLIGTRRYLAYQPGSEVPEAPEIGDTP